MIDGRMDKPLDNILSLSALPSNSNSVIVAYNDGAIQKERRALSRVPTRNGRLYKLWVDDHEKCSWYI